MPYDRSYPANGIKIRAVDFQNQLAAMKAIIDDQAAEIVALQVPVPVAVQVVGLSYHSGPGTMDVTFAPTGGDNAAELAVLWWPEGGAVTRTPLTLPTQTVPVGSATGATFWQTEVQNAAGVTVLSAVLSYFIS